MSNKFILTILCCVVIGAALAWILSAPKPLPSAELAALSDGDAKAGEMVFWAGGCASCHAAPKAEGDAKLVLAGGHRFDTPFGVFIAPNVSPDPEYGIGKWSLPDFANAMKRGIRPDGAHYYPAFPYTSYSRMSGQDVADLFAYMQTLPKVAEAAPDHQISFPFNIRRSLGLWKLLFFDPSKVVPVPRDDQQLVRGRYLVEGLGHCGACHTPRNLLGGPRSDSWLAGGPSPEGKGTIPNITPHPDGMADWGAQDIVYMLETGFTPEYDSVGSTMADVQLNMARLPASDREAIAAYLKFIPALPTPK